MYVKPLKDEANVNHNSILYENKPEYYCHLAQIEVKFLSFTKGQTTTKKEISENEISQSLFLPDRNYSFISLI